MDSFINNCRKNEKDCPHIPIVIGGINTKKNAVAFLENFAQFDIAMWGEGEEQLLQLLKTINNSNDYSHIPNIAYRDGSTIVSTTKMNEKFVDLSKKDLYPDYDDYLLNSTCKCN